MRYCKLLTLWICIVSTSKLLITNNFVALHVLQTYWVTYSFSMNLFKICFGKWDGLIIKTVHRAKWGGTGLVLLCHQWELFGLWLVGRLNVLNRLFWREVMVEIQNLKLFLWYLGLPLGLLEGSFRGNWGQPIEHLWAFILHFCVERSCIKEWSHTHNV